MEDEENCPYKNFVEKNHCYISLGKIASLLTLPEYWAFSRLRGHSHITSALRGEWVGSKEDDSTDWLQEWTRQGGGGPKIPDFCRRHM